MRNLFKNVANEVVQQLTPEDLKEIMDSTIDTVLARMTPEQRLEFSQEIVNNAVTKLLAGFSEEQRVELLRSILPTILKEMRLEKLQLEELIEALQQGSDK